MHATWFRIYLSIYLSIYQEPHRQISLASMAKPFGAVESTASTRTSLSSRVLMAAVSATQVDEETWIPTKDPPLARIHPLVRVTKDPTP